MSIKIEELSVGNICMAFIAGKFQACIVAEVPLIETGSKFAPTLGRHLEVHVMREGVMYVPQRALKQLHELCPIPICMHIACNIFGFKHMKEWVFDLKCKGIDISLQYTDAGFMLRVWPDKYYTSQDFEVHYMHQVQNILAARYGIKLTPILP